MSAAAPEDEVFRASLDSRVKSSFRISLSCFMFSTNSRCRRTLVMGWSSTLLTFLFVFDIILAVYTVCDAWKPPFARYRQHNRTLK
jgi:hypothetical protein